ncbi:MAG: hypothetical protein ACFE7E_04560 [Candidatus Hodarchaeota archaeon]
MKMHAGEISRKDLLIIIRALRDIEHIIRRPRCEAERRIVMLKGESKHSEDFKSYPISSKELPNRLDELYQILIKVYGDVGHSGEGHIKVKE